MSSDIGEGEGKRGYAYQCRGPIDLWRVCGICIYLGRRRRGRWQGCLRTGGIRGIRKNEGQRRENLFLRETVRNGVCSRLQGVN
jgi:hypothetical protein